MKKNIVYFFLPTVLIVMFIADASSYLFQNPKPMYFRAWEYMINEGKDSYYAPFKPLSKYDALMQGDLLLLAGLTPSDGEVRKQTFITDEYGFRNSPGLLSKPIKAVVVGTSFVGGAQETQEYLISNMLTYKYHFPTYNYATLPLQHFWEDLRFKVNKPEYVIIIGNEAEILQNSWIEVLSETNTTHNVRKWKSFTQWKKINMPVEFKFSTISKDLKRYSILRHYSKQMWLRISNDVITRDVLTMDLKKNGTYDPVSDILFWDIVNYNPLLNSSSKLAIKQTVSTLKKTKMILEKRGIKLIVVIMPSKASLHSSKFRHVPLSKKTLPELEKQLEQVGVKVIPLSKQARNTAIVNDQLLYYREDGHWNTRANIMIYNNIKKVLE